MAPPGAMSGGLRHVPVVFATASGPSIPPLAAFTPEQRHGNATTCILPPTLTDRHHRPAHLRFIPERSRAFHPHPARVDQAASHPLPSSRPLHLLRSSRGRPSHPNETQGASQGVKKSPATGAGRDTLSFLKASPAQAERKAPWIFRSNCRHSRQTAARTREVCRTLVARARAATRRSRCAADDRAPRSRSRRSGSSVKLAGSSKLAPTGGDGAADTTGTAGGGIKGTEGGITAVGWASTMGADGETGTKPSAAARAAASSARMSRYPHSIREISEGLRRTALASAP